MERDSYASSRLGYFFLTIVVLIGTALYGALHLYTLNSAERVGAARLDGLQHAATIAPWVWRYQYDLGLVYRAVGRYEIALAYYDAAIREFPRCGICWVARAEVEAAMGRNPEASIANAARYGRSQTGVRTRTAVLYAKLGKHSEALREFGAAASGQVDNVNEFFGALHAIYDTSEVLHKVVPDDKLGLYFNYARQYLDPESVTLVWESFRESSESKLYRKFYAADLLRSGQVHSAWHTSFGDDAPIAVDLLSPGFEPAGDRHPWGWRIADGDGVRAKVIRCGECGRDGRALRLSFDGESNPDYRGVVQYVPVFPGAAYLLKARVKYEGLTSARGPSLVVQGISGTYAGPTSACNFRVDGEQFLNSSDWREVQVAFPVPRPCEGIGVMVARSKTNKLNRFIDGTLTVDDIHLEILRLPEQPFESSPEAATGSLTPVS